VAIKIDRDVADETRCVEIKLQFNAAATARTLVIAWMLITSIAKN
jgi:hypothetical protein